MSKIPLTCEKCGKRFERERGEHNRNLKKGRKTYCSLKCTGNILNIPVDKICHDPSYLNPANRLDEFSPYRWHLKGCRRRNKENGCGVSITLQDLKEQWEKQNGKCPYTGWDLKNLDKTSPSSQLPLTPDRASLDRIDSSKGYEKDNIQFVSFMAQCAKNVFTEEDVLRFAEAVAINSS